MLNIYSNSIIKCCRKLCNKVIKRIFNMKPRNGVMNFGSINFIEETKSNYFISWAWNSLQVVGYERIKSRTTVEYTQFLFEQLSNNFPPKIGFYFRLNKLSTKYIIVFVTEAAPPLSLCLHIRNAISSLTSKTHRACSTHRAFWNVKLCEIRGLEWN